VIVQTLTLRLDGRSLTDDEIDAITRSVNRTHTPDAESALDFTGGAPALAARDRDTSVYAQATLPLETGDGITMVEGRALDGGTAIYRRGSGDFVILQRKGEAYFPVATAGSKSNALAKANRIPIFTGLAELPPDATDMQRQAHDFKGKLIVEVGIAPVKPAEFVIFRIGQWTADAQPS